MITFGKIRNELPPFRPSSQKNSILWKYMEFKFWSTRSSQYKMHFRSPRPVISPHLEGFTAK
uniref:Ovule protein n=1 Tax=Bursaphelenchus xylophilus TaxID=6326 RepID=A0A1I7SN60_BURXY